MARIGTVGYLNARPLTDRVDIDRHTLLLAHPAEVSRLLRDGEVDVALVPVAAALDDPDYRVVPGWCIGAEGPVASVLLVAETEPEQWTKVVLDGVSRTSVVLAQLLLKHGPLAARVRPDLVIERVAPNQAVLQAKKGTAAVMIGDAARALPDRLGVRLDLAELWTQWTGLPFVFAVWAGRADLDPAVVEDLIVAGRRGVAGIDDKYAGADLRYLTQNLRYPLDDAALTGLRRFGALAHQAGLVPRADLELYAPVSPPRPAGLDALLARALEGSALPVGDLLTLLRHAPVAELAAAAELRRLELHPGDAVGLLREAVLPAEAPVASLAEAVRLGATRIRLEGPVDAARVAEVAAACPGCALAVDAMPEDPAALAAAGLTDVIEPVGSLADRVRGEAGPAAAWLHGASLAAGAGLRLEATVALGRGESEEELAAHLLRLRELPGLHAVRVWAAAAPGPFGSVANTATDVVRVTALARLVLPGAVHVEAAPESEGLGMMQVALRAGADHAGVVRVGATEAAEEGRRTLLVREPRDVGLQLGG
ncbi:MAG: MqnA/MqnD/SBP family protein [Myxococcota bacterium]